MVIEGHSQEQERNDHPCKEINPERIRQHTSWSICVGSEDTRVGNEYCPERQPESTIRRERCDRNG